MSGSEPITTFVLSGEKPVGDLMVYQKRQEIAPERNKILTASPTLSVTEAVSQIKGPANIILACHGRDAHFVWRESEAPTLYTNLFKAMPREDINCIAITSCYGSSGISEASLKEAPPGALVIALVGKDTINISGNNKAFAIEIAPLTKPIDLLLEALDNFDPKQYEATIAAFKSEKGQTYKAKPEDALPHIIGIGGGQPLDLARAVGIVNQLGKNNKLNESAWSTAIAHVEERFDTKNFYSTAANPLVTAYGNRGDQTTLNQQIEAVAAKLKAGSAPSGLEETRIAYALTAAYLESSGSLGQMIDKAKRDHGHPSTIHTASVQPQTGQANNPYEVALASHQAADLLQSIGVTGDGKNSAQIAAPKATPVLRNDAINTGIC